MANQAIRNLNYAFFGLIASLALCVALRPQGLWANDGFSYFGGLRVTVIPYTLGYLSFGLFLIKASSQLGGDGIQRLLKLIFRICFILVLGLAVTPHNIPPFDEIHVTFGTALFLIEFLTGAWLVWQMNQLRSWALFALSLVGGLFSLYYLPHKYGLLLENQIIFQLAVWGIWTQAIKFQTVL